MKELSMQWDLSDLFSGPDDPELESTLDSAHAQAVSLAESFRGRVESCGASELRNGIETLEAIAEKLSRVVSYAHLRFSEDTGDPERGAFLQAIQERVSEINVLILFFELEIQAASDEWTKRMLEDAVLAEYRHWLERVRVNSPHRLSEAEEVLLERTANTGIRAWQRLHEELTATHVFHYKDPHTGEIRESTLNGLTSLLRDPDRAVRQAAADSLTEGLLEMEKVIVFCYNTILADKKLEDDLRGYEYPEQSRHMANELGRDTVELVVDLCEKNHPIVERYYEQKRQLLGLDELTHIDRCAPIDETKASVAYSDAAEIILDSFGAFSPEMARIAREFFERGWIDAEPRKGKAGGAFCEYVTPSAHPYILMTYQDKLDDVMTLAHELGHGVHAYLSREQRLFNFHGTLPLAELASIFGEMLVFDQLVRQASKEDQLSLYAQKIEGIFSSVFRQAAMFRFERECHNIRRDEGELSADEFASIWQRRLQEMFGSSVRLGDQHKHWWLYVGHFFFAPFYVYAYAFGELLTLALYERSKQEGRDFAERYLDVLRKGGSMSPHDLMLLLDIDLSSPQFWAGGFSFIDRMVAQFEELSKNAIRS